MRDAKRQRLYDAEDKTLCDSDFETRFDSLNECQEYLQRVTKSRYFRSHYPQSYVLRVGPKRIDSCHFGSCDPDYREILLRGHIWEVNYKSGNGSINSKSFSSEQDADRYDRKQTSLGFITYRRFQHGKGYKDWMVLHELAHNIQYWDPPRHESGYLINPGADHGWYFAKVYLDLVRRFMGREPYLALKGEFVKKKVRFRKPKVLAPETVLALRERIKTIRQT